MSHPAGPARFPTTVRKERFLRKCAAARQALQRALDQPEKAEAAVLKGILECNGDTAFAREHGLGGVRTMEEFRAAVPIRTYDDLAPWIARVVGGEANVLTQEAPYLFLRTAGTTGPSKLIPMTRHWRLHFRGPAIYAQWSTYFQYHPALLDHPHGVMDLSWERDEPKEFVAEIPSQAITHRSESLGGADWTPPWYDAPWFRFDRNSADYLDRIYLRIRHFVGRDLRGMVAVNPSTLVAFSNHLARTTERLIKDVRMGELFGERQFAPDPKLARSLESRAARLGHLTARALWPNLNLLVCWKSASASMYLGHLTELFPNAEILPFSTTGTEGVVTLPVDRHPTSGVLALNQGLYEFIPHDSREEAPPADAVRRTYSPWELSAGRVYRLVMTQANGLYRYAAADLYKVLGFVGRVPRLEFAGREGHFSSFTGEKLTETQVMRAGQEALAHCGLQWHLFTCCPAWGQPPHYTFVIEPRGRWSFSLVPKLEEELESQLAIANSEYAGKRGSTRLGKLEVRLVEPGTFQRLWDARVRQGTVSSAQLKHRWLQKDAQVLDDLQHLYAKDQSSAVAF